jgi:hypothetical protein
MGCVELGVNGAGAARSAAATTPRREVSATVMFPGGRRRPSLGSNRRSRFGFGNMTPRSHPVVHVAKEGFSIPPIRGWVSTAGKRHRPMDDLLESPKARDPTLRLIMVHRRSRRCWNLQIEATPEQRIARIRKPNRPAGMSGRAAEESECDSFSNIHRVAPTVAAMTPAPCGVGWTPSLKSPGSLSSGVLLSIKVAPVLVAMARTAGTSVF